jgi:hypothetical protein
MADTITFIETDDIKYKIELIMRQTNYTEDNARTNLKLFNYDHIKVIKNFMGITEKKEPVIKSVNQEIYKQLRYKLDDIMKSYNTRKDNGETKII